MNYFDPERSYVRRTLPPPLLTLILVGVPLPTIGKIAKSPLHYFKIKVVLNRNFGAKKVRIKSDFQNN